MKEKWKSKRLLSLLLALVMVVGMLPSTVAFAATGSGNSASDPVVVSDFAEFKTAMEDSTIQYVKLTGTKTEDLPANTSLEAAITVVGTKYLTIEGNTTFASNGGHGYDCLLVVMGTANLYVSGTGTLQFSPQLSGGTNAVIRQDGGNVSVTGNVTLKSQSVNYATYGYSINHHYGKLDIASGNLIGSSAKEGVDNSAVAVKCDDASDVTITGGKFEVVLYNGVVKKQPGLIISDKSSTKGVKLSGGSFINGIVTGSRTTTYQDYLVKGCEATEEADGTITIDNSATTPEKISTVSVTVAAPVAGATAPKNIPATVPSDANYTAELLFWVDKASVQDVDTFEAGHSYYARVEVTPKAGYELAANPVVTINGKETHVSLPGFFDSADFAVSVEGTDNYVTEAAVQIEEPVAGVKPLGTESITVLSDNKDKIKRAVMWWYGMQDGETAFVIDQEYTAVVQLTPQEGVTFAPDMKLTVNGKVADIMPKGSSGTVQFHVKFTAVAPPTDPNYVREAAVQVAAPVVGEKPSFNGITVTSSNADKIKVAYVLWTQTSFVAGQEYETIVYLEPKEGVTFADDMKLNVNGEVVERSRRLNNDDRSAQFKIKMTAVDPSTPAPTEYTITFDGNGGSGNMDSVNVKAETAYSLPACGFTAPEKKQFKAWEIGGTEYKVNASVTVTADITVKALWEDVPPAHEHSYSSDWKYDTNNHWKECSCGEKSEMEGHTPGAAATETTPQTCTKCGYVIKAASVKPTEPTDPTNPNKPAKPTEPTNPSEPANPTAPNGAKKVNGDYVNTKYKKASIKKLKKGKKKITVQWKKVSGVKGYQIQYSTSKKFTKKTTKSATISKQKTTSKTLKKLKSKKKYYVRIRTYKTVKFNGKTVKVYSSWSKVKSIKTK